MNTKTYTYIQTQDNFYNKVVSDLTNEYFPNQDLKALYENNLYLEVKQIVELFSNGCAHYEKLIRVLSRKCNDTNINIHTIVKNYVISFGEYEYKPGFYSALSNKKTKKALCYQKP